MLDSAGQEAGANVDHYARSRTRWPQPGTRSATRRLIVLTGRARWVKHERTPDTSRRLVQAQPHSLSRLEEVTPLPPLAEARPAPPEGHGQAAPRQPAGLAVGPR